MTRVPTIVGLDIETTGLDRDKDFPLEVGMIVYTDDLVELDATSILVRPPSFSIIDDMTPEVRDMHLNNGLLDELLRLRAHANHLQEVRRVELYLELFLRKHFPMYPAAVPLDEAKPRLMGNNVESFDRHFLRRISPAIERGFHYRTLNVSSLREMVARWEPTLLYEREAAKHRALDDIRASADELRHYKNVLFV